MKYLDEFASSGEAFSVDKLMGNLTLDIIGAAVLGADLNAQQLDTSKQGEVARLFTEILQTYHDEKSNLPWWLAPFTMSKRYRLT